MVGTSGANTPGSSVVFSCDQGYMLTGPATIVCQADGTWSGLTPSCVVGKPLNMLLHSGYITADGRGRREVNTTA